jgi:hypothetical protein
MSFEQLLFEEMKIIDLLLEILKYRASLLWMFNVYEFCCFNLLRKHALLSFSIKLY